MPKAFDNWQVFPHRPLEKLEPNLWRVEGNLPRGPGHRVMTLVKLPSGGLVVHNAIALEDAAMQKLEGFGRPAFIVVPGAFHRQDARIWKDRYPSAKVVSPRGAMKSVSKIVPVELSYAEAPSDDGVKLAHFEGVKEREGYVEVHSAEGTTLIINDVICNLPKSGGLLGFFMGPTGQPSVPRVTRWLVAKDRGALGEDIDRLARIPDLRRLIFSHGDNIDVNVAGALQTARATA